MMRQSAEKIDFGEGQFDASTRTVALGSIFFSCREERIHHRAHRDHRDHRENYFCSRERGLQGYGSLFVGPQFMPAFLLRDLCGEIFLGLRPTAAL
jgi:hypothetical protein